MASAANKVVGGDYKGWEVTKSFGTVFIQRFVKSIAIDSTTVTSYALVDQNQRKSMASGIVRGTVGGIIAGPVGAIAGGISGKNKGIYKVQISFVDGASSLLEVDDEFYQMIVNALAAGTASVQTDQQFAAQQPSAQLNENGTPYTAADELKKYKELLDTGVITQKEFNKKKKQLLQ